MVFRNAHLKAEKGNVRVFIKAQDEEEDMSEDTTDIKSFFYGLALYGLMAFFVFALGGCAAIQGYHSYDEDAGYPAHPGNGSAQVQYMARGGPGYGRVNGTTTTPEQAILTIAQAQILDAQAEAMRECVKNNNCAMFPYGGRYSRPGYTLSGIQAARQWKSGENEAGHGQLERIERGVRVVAKYQLQMGKELEKHLSEVKETNESPAPSDTVGLPQELKEKN